MPDYNVHIKKYEHNKKFSNKLIGDNDEIYSDWQTVAIFYAALHLVEAIFSKQFNEHTTSHEKRHEKMLNNFDIFNKNVMRYYRSLKALSTKARYKDIIDDNDDYYMAKECFENFEEELRNYF